ncbi:MAG: SUMF1/EgtB/PvdO family nonheme iron enzyme, partial [Deltaproteobacteria bacterium]|nr:SUMF1/EgtB/PvdO family nonheme iron enzyme [Deltaproteobacteria bacterium]
MSRHDDVGSQAELRWLHISDIHMTEEPWRERRELVALLEFVDAQRDAGLAPHVVFATGDLADKGKPAQFIQVAAFFTELMSRAGLTPEEHLFLVPGNHDVDRGVVDDMDRLVVESLLSTKDQAALKERLNKSKVMGEMANRLDAFYRFTADLLGAKRAWVALRPWRTDIIEAQGLTLAILQLNSSWASGQHGNDEGKKLLMGLAQVEDALRDLDLHHLRIALMHHPLDWLADFDESVVDDLLVSPRGAHIVLRGHLHKEKTFHRLDPDGCTLMHAAGTLYVQEQWPRGFLVGTLSPAANETSVQFFGYKDSSGGFWRPEQAYKGLDSDGLWTRPLPEGWLTSPTPLPAATLALPPLDRHVELIEEYRRNARTSQAVMSFTGYSARKRGPESATITELFAPLQMVPRGVPLRSDAPTIDITSLVNRLLRRDGEGRAERVVVLGAPGSGKTTLTRYLGVWAAGGFELPGIDRPERLIPLTIRFRDLVQDVAKGAPRDLLDYLARHSGELLRQRAPREFFERILADGDALVILDGFDEVSQRGERSPVQECVVRFAAAHPRCPLLVTSREAGYDDAALPGPRAGEEDTPERSGAAAHPPASCGPDDVRPFDHLMLRPLTDAALEQLIRNWYAVQERADPRKRRDAIDDLLGALSTEPRVRHLAHTPLLATLICLVHRESARLPGERAKLYDKVVDTLLDSWPSDAGLSSEFEGLDADRQRRYLQELALVMQTRRAEATDANQRDHAHPESGDAVVIEHDTLVADLARICCVDDAADETANRRRMARWVAWLAERTGLLVEHETGVFAFLHLTLMEYLAACAVVAREGAPGVDELAGFLAKAVEAPAWREPVRLAIGVQANQLPFIEALLGAFRDASPLHRVVLLEGLHEGMDATPKAVGDIVRAVLEDLPNLRQDSAAAEAVDTLVQLCRFSPRHSEAARRSVQQTLLEWPAGRRLDDALLEALPTLITDPSETLAAVTHLAPLTTDGDQSYWLWAATEAVEARWPDAAAEARALRGTLFDHFAEPDPALFDPLVTVHDGPQPGWGDVPAGTFLMGSPDDDPDAQDREKPRHPVTLTRGFRMGAVPVTNRQFLAFDPDFEPFAFKGVSKEQLPEHPAVTVSWYAATSFCRWLDSRGAWSRGARLPTDAEWERAARGGKDTRYWSGDEVSDLE